MTKRKSIFRKVKKGETINYYCGCIAEVEIINKPNFEGIRITLTNLCFEHDITITKYAREHEDKIDWDTYTI